MKQESSRGETSTCGAAVRMLGVMFVGVMLGWINGLKVSVFLMSDSGATAGSREATAVDAITSVVSPSAINDTLAPEPHEDTYTVVVVRCAGNVTWLNDVPSNWRVVVYDKCGTNTSAEFNLTQHDFVSHDAPNVGSEECTTYLKYILDYYDNLTDVTVFAHDDALRPYRKADIKHTPFDTFTELSEAVEQFMTPDRPFLHLGDYEIPEKWGSDPYHGEAMRTLWPFTAMPDEADPSALSKETMLQEIPECMTFMAGAHFAVRKETILRRPKHSYWPIIQKIYHSEKIPGTPDCRKLCCAMERMWHVIFGQPPVLTKESMIKDLLNISHCRFCTLASNQSLASQM